MKSLITRWLALALVLATPSVLAHDPGISALQVCADGPLLRAQWLMNASDLDWLTADSAWPAGARRLLKLDAGSRPLAPANFTADTSADGGWRLAWEFAVDEPGNELTLTATALDRFRYGHRIHATACTGGRLNTNGTLLSEAHPSWDLLAAAGPAPGLFDPGLIASGVMHILTGWDHLLFLLLLLLAAVSLRQAVILVTLFALAHSLTLGLGAMGWLNLPPQPVEAAIAASIVIAALLNLAPRRMRGGYPLAFGFGLIHGLGFAAFTSDMLTGASPSLQLQLLAQVNLGIELGQLGIVLLIVPLIAWLRRAGLGRISSVAGSSVAGGLGCVWMLQRLLG